MDGSCRGQDQVTRDKELCLLYNNIVYEAYCDDQSSENSLSTSLALAFFAFTNNVEIIPQRSWGDP